MVLLVGVPRAGLGHPQLFVIKSFGGGVAVAEA